MDRRRFLELAMLGAGGVATARSASAAQDGAAERRVIVSKVRFVGSRVVMALTIGGQGPFDFLLDTGGHLSLIATPLAQQLKLVNTGQTRAMGIGGTAVLPVFLAQDVVFGGGARQTSVAFAGMAGGFGRDAMGTLAAGFLTAIDSDLDMEAGEWRAYPDGRPPLTGYSRIKDAIVASGTGPAAGSRRLFGDAVIDGRKARFLLDTGMPGGVRLDHGFAKRIGLWDDARPWAPERSSGIGGNAAVGRLVRADALELAGNRIERPLVALSAAGDGETPGMDGAIGLAVLRHFILATDARSRDLWLKPHAAAAPVPERYNLSGLWLDQRGGGWRVAQVGFGSPAAAAGIAIGDGVATTDDRPVLRAMAGRPGSVVALKVTRGDATRDVMLTLREYL